MITYIDTNGMEDISKELSQAAKDLNTEFDALFKRLSNVPTVTKEWVGNKANFYFSRVALDKPQYTTFVNDLISISHEISREASEAQLRIKANNSKD